MNDESLFEFLESEIGYIKTESYKYGTEADAKTLERIAKKTHFIEDVLSCRRLSATQVAQKDLPHATKKVVLEMFDHDVLIAELLQQKEK